MLEIINKFKPKMSSGHDEIPTKIMKQSILSIIQPLTYIINKSLEPGVLQNKLKIAKAVPIFKFSKKGRLEKIIFNKLLKVGILYTNTRMVFGLSMQPFT
jgi:hypothetical protein